MPNPFAVIALTAYMVTVAALLLYRRDGAAHCPQSSWVAWLLLVIAGGSAIEQLVYAGDVGPFDAGRAALLALLIVRTRGNVARLLWSDK